MKHLLLIMLLVSSTALAQDSERDYSQAAIDALMADIDTHYGIGFAVREEWIASSAGELIRFVDYLHEIANALEVAAESLHQYASASPDTSPQDFFRGHFGAAHILIDRSTGLEGRFYGNTLPLQTDDGVIYLIQLTPAGMSSPFTLLHELGHVLDDLLHDQPQQDFVAALGGAWTETAWIPGHGYRGNEELFPRAPAGPNEDFADTFANMLLGRLSPQQAPQRYFFMQRHLPDWLASVQTMSNMR